MAMGIQYLRPNQGMQPQQNSMQSFTQGAQAVQGIRDSIDQRRNQRQAQKILGSLVGPPTREQYGELSRLLGPQFAQSILVLWDNYRQMDVNAQATANERLRRQTGRASQVYGQLLAVPEQERQNMLNTIMNQAMRDPQAIEEMSIAIKFLSNPQNLTDQNLMYAAHDANSIAQATDVFGAHTARQKELSDVETQARADQVAAQRDAEVAQAALGGNLPANVGTEELATITGLQQGSADLRNTQAENTGMNLQNEQSIRLLEEATPDVEQRAKEKHSIHGGSLRDWIIHEMAIEKGDVEALYGREDMYGNVTPLNLGSFDQGAGATTTQNPFDTKLQPFTYHWQNEPD